MSKDCKQEIKSEQDVEIPEKSNGFLCPTCGAHYFSEDYFVEHIKEHKTISSCTIKQELTSDPDKPPVFICPVCAEHVYSDTQLIEHVKQHHDHSSPEVPDYFDTADNLPETDTEKTLVLSPSESPPVKPFKCSQCLFSAAYSSTLVQHQNIHSGDRAFKCSECSFASKQASNLTRHMSSKRPGVGFGRGRGRECPNFAGAGNWPFWNLAGAGAVNLINPRPS